MFGDVAQPEEYQTVEFTVYKSAKVMSPPDMPDYMLDYTIAKAKELLEGDDGSNAQEIATALKRDLDEKWQPCWRFQPLKTFRNVYAAHAQWNRHVTVGKNFASYVVHQKRRFVYFSLGKMSFLVYKAQ